MKWIAAGVLSVALLSNGCASTNGPIPDAYGPPAPAKGEPETPWVEPRWMKITGRIFIGLLIAAMIYGVSRKDGSKNTPTDGGPSPSPGEPPEACNSPPYAASNPAYCR